MAVDIRVGDCLDVLRTLDAESVQCVVTSPPYWGLRDYGHAGQLGLEKTPSEYVAKMVAVFAEVWRVLRDDGTLWLNLGDSYAARGNSGGNGGITNVQASSIRERGWRGPPPGMKDKDLVGVPWMVAFALRGAGWYLRSDIIWHKPNPMPESVTDRPTKAHEYLFLLSKAERYYYDAAAIAEPIADSSIERLSQDVESQDGSARANGGTRSDRPMKAVVRMDRGEIGSPSQMRALVSETGDRYMSGRVRAKFNAENGLPLTRNKRTVWTVATAPYSGAHFATFPPALIEPCIRAGSRPGDTVLDPFGGAGTTGLVASRLSRNALLIELNPEYAALARKRIDDDGPLLSGVVA